MTSIDNGPKIGIDPLLSKTVKRLGNDIDGLIDEIDKAMEETDEFEKKYKDKLESKEKFYED